jgi:hypothetical protein
MINKLIRNTLQKFGYDIIKKTVEVETDRTSKEFKEIYQNVRPYTMTSIDRIWALHNAVKYVHNNKIEGDIVECGVWRGGSSMVSALTLLNNSDIQRSIYMYDTYEGMSEPTGEDVSVLGDTGEATWQGINQCYADLEDVSTNIYGTGYPKDKIKLIKGKVEETIPNTIPDKISLLRLDTDWYESTYHELVHLFPRLVKGGVLIIDDYGHWQGARKAVDQYFEENNIPILLNWIDYTGRIAIKI